MLANLRQYAAIVFLFLGAIAVLVYLGGRDHLEDFEEYHANLSATATAHGKGMVELYLSDLRRAIEVFSEHYSTQIRQLADDPGNDSIASELELALSYYFTEPFAFTVANSNGETVFISGLGGIGKRCRQNIRLFALDRSRANAAMVMHGSGDTRHFDVMTPLFIKDGRLLILFVSFCPDELTRFLESAQVRHHSMYVVREGSGDIEIGPPQRSGIDAGDARLADDEMQRILSRRLVENTQWELVDLLEAGMWEREFWQVVTESLIVFALFVGAGVVALVKISAIEQSRQEVQQQLKAHEQELEQTVRERTLALKKANERLERLSLSDGLTGIANRRQFDAILNREIGRANRENKPLSLLLFDIDFFKNYNDSEGHLAGDDCLRKIARAVEAEFKRGGDLTARYGGEEFAVILPGSDLDEMQRQAERVREIIWNLNIPHPDSPVADRVTVSVGGSTLRRDQYKTANELIDEADEALYRAKAAGRNLYRAYVS